ncbi:MAG: DUF4339 domain-containing protein [Chthoniobacterales bacterium]|nr:DUF4339 domain-containing protein [Chthoniobacterales bacterium]
MNVYIARDGVELGEFPGSELAKRARAGELWPTDYYWIEGMDSWLLLGDRLPPETWQQQEKTPPVAAPAPAPVEAAPKVPDPATPAPPGVVPEVVAEPAVESKDNAESEAADEFFPVLPAAPAAPLPFALPARRTTLLVGGILAAVLVLAIGAFFLFSERDDPANPPLRLRPTPTPAPPIDRKTDLADRDRAAAVLRERIEQLPIRATPPQNLFYFDLRVRMGPSSRHGSRWTAVLTGTENTVDPEADKPIRQTKFTLTTDYRGDAWTYLSYEAVVTDLLTLDGMAVKHAADAEAPPSLATILGLRIESQ